MQKTIWTLPPEKDYRAARHQFLDIYGEATVMNAYLRVAVVGLSLVCVLLVVLLGKTEEGGNPVKFHDDTYEMDITWYTTGVSFVQKIRLVQPVTAVKPLAHMVGVGAVCYVHVLQTL